MALTDWLESGSLPFHCHRAFLARASPRARGSRSAGFLELRKPCVASRSSRPVTALPGSEANSVGRQTELANLRLQSDDVPSTMINFVAGL